MPGQLVPVGPFLGGLNTFSDPSSIADNELVVANNVELDLDGSLKSRPPFLNANINFPLGATGDINLLGYFYDSSGSPFLLASNGLNNTYFFTGSAWVSVFGAGGTAFAATAMTQYDGKAWLVAPVGSAGSSGYWVSGGTYGTFTAQANMPKGDYIANWQERLWTGRNTDSILYYSNVLTDAAGTWVASNANNVIGTGDGQSIVQIVVYFNTLLIFRSRSIWSWSYSGRPEDGTISQVVGGIGLASKESLAQFESYIYFMFEDRAYEFTNGRAAHLNIKVPLRANTQAGIYLPFAVSELNRRIIFSYYDTMYVFNLVTRTWTTWSTSQHGSIGKIFKRESDSTDTIAYAHSSTAVTGATRNAKTITISDTLPAATSSSPNFGGEAMTCVVQTKNMDYNFASQYKRLFWWGVDASFRGTVTAIAAPITYNQQITWGQLLSTTWGGLLNFTWGQPQTPQILIETVRSTAGLSPGRQFIKFLKSARFRQIYFKLTTTTTGTTSTAPLRIFHIHTYIGVKEIVSKPIT
jgi:hypothetical protein